MSINVELIKLAARAWKLHHLSDENRTKLEHAGVLNYDKELAGLTLGSDNIAKGKNVIENYTPNSNAGMTMVTGGTYRDPAPTKETFVPHEPIAKVQYTIEYGDTSPASLVRTHRKSTGEAYKPDEWAKQLVRRHELDEVSAMDHIIHKSLKKGMGKAYKPSRIEDAAYTQEQLDHLSGPLVAKINRDKVYTHANPEVLRRESGHLAGAPLHMREDFTALRDFRPKVKHRVTPSYLSIRGRVPSEWNQSTFISERDAIESTGLRYGTQARANTVNSFGKNTREALSAATSKFKSRFSNYLVSKAPKSSKGIGTGLYLLGRLK